MNNLTRIRHYLLDADCQPATREAAPGKRFMPYSLDADNADDTDKLFKNPRHLRHPRLKNNIETL